jgi:hypothetical protein
MNTHVRIVAILHIVLSALGLIAAIILFAVFGVTGGIVLSQGEGTAASVIGIVGLFIAGLVTLLSLPGIIGGWALLAGKAWGRTLIIIVGILELLNFPLGTALGIYTLWALLDNRVQQQVYPYSERP